MRSSREITHFLAARYGLALPLGVRRVDHGGWNQIYQVSGADGTWALRLSHRQKQRQQLTFELALLDALAARLTFVPAIRRTAEGALYAMVDGTFCTLLRWMPGTPLPRNDDTVEGAGFALGQIHAALVHLAPGLRHVSDLSMLAFDWTDNMLSTGDVLAGTSAPLPIELATELEFLRAARFRLDRWLQQCRREHRFAAGITHGDFYHGNVLFAGGQVSAVLDWDEATTSWTAYEVANAIWEFARDDRRAAIDAHRRNRFRAGYAAACPLPSLTAADEARLIAVRRLIEIQHALFELRAGRAVDLDYTALNLRFLQELLARAG